MRVLVWNVHGFRAGSRRVAAAVEALRPDLALLNEVGVLGFRLSRFAGRMGMRAVSGLRVRRHIPNAVLVREPLRVVSAGLARFPDPGERTRRGAAIVVVGRGDERLTAVSVHLGLVDPRRPRDARALLAGLEAQGGRAIVGGDLNEGPDMPAAELFASGLTDAFAAAGEGGGLTFPAREPRARIDYLFASPGIEVQRAWVVPTTASDHLPLVADLSL